MKTEIVRTYEQCNDIIRMHRDSYVEAGQCLATVRDLELYRTKGGYETFEEYCKQEWGWSRSYVFRIIGAAELAARLLPIGNIQNAKKAEITQNAPPAESVAREILVATTDEKQQAKVWKAAVAKAEANGKPVTAATVKAVAAEVLGEPTREPGDDGDQPEHDETIEDAFGPVHKSLREVFAKRTEFTSLVQQIGGLRNDIIDLQQEEGGAAIEIEGVKTLFKELKAAIKFAAPYCECPKCQRSKRECDMCNGFRWIPELVWSRNKTEEWEAWLRGDRA